MKEFLGVLRSFGKTGYRTPEVILGKLCPHLKPGTSEYERARVQAERELNAAAKDGLARRDILDFPEALIPCYQIA